MRVICRVSMGGTSRPVWQMPRLYGRDSAAANFDLLSYRTGRDANHGRDTNFTAASTQSKHPRPIDYLLVLSDDPTVASLRRALCTVGRGFGIHLPAPLRESVLRRKATAVRRALRDRSLYRPCSEGWKCGRFLADQRHYPAGAFAPDEAFHIR